MTQIYVKPGTDPATGKTYRMRDEYTRQRIGDEGCSVKLTTLTDRRFQRGEFLIYGRLRGQTGPTFIECRPDASKPAVRLSDIQFAYPGDSQTDETKPQKRLAREKFDAEKAGE